MEIFDYMSFLQPTIALLWQQRLVRDITWNVDVKGVTVACPSEQFHSLVMFLLQKRC